jgi:hypothetical protein
MTLTAHYRVIGSITRSISKVKKEPGKLKREMSRVQWL